MSLINSVVLVMCVCCRMCRMSRRRSLCPVIGQRRLRAFYLLWTYHHAASLQDTAVLLRTTNPSIHVCSFTCWSY